MPRRRVLPAIALAFALLAGVQPCRAHAQGQLAEIDQSTLRLDTAAVASELVRGIRQVRRTDGAPPRVIVLLFSPADTDLPPYIRDLLSDQLQSELQTASHGAIDLVDQDGLDPAWNQLAFTNVNADYNELASRAAADVLVHARVTFPNSDQIAIRYVAVELRSGKPLLTLARTNAVALPRAAVYAPLPPDQALHSTARALARRLAERLQQETAAGFSLRVEDSGMALAASWLRQFRQAFEGDTRRELGRYRHVVDDRSAHAEPAPLRLSLTLTDTQSAVEAEFTVSRDPDADGGGFRMSESARIAKNTIDQDLLASLYAVAGVRATFGEAVLAGLQDRPMAEQAARAIARSKRLALLSPSAATGLSEAASPADVRRALAALEGGVTYDERWTMTTANGRLRATLEARALPSQSELAPLTVTVPPILQEGERLTIDIGATRPTKVAIFEWQSDDRVVRVYPRRRADASDGGLGLALRMLDVGPGSPLHLPRQDDKKVAVAPTRGMKVDVEALIVISSARDVEFASLPGSDFADRAPDATIPVPIGDLFDALARQRVPVRVTAVPYEIHAR